MKTRLVLIAVILVVVAVAGGVFLLSSRKERRKVVQFLYTLGKYDDATVIEAPSDEALLKTTLGLGSLGNVRTTLKAWTAPEATKVFSQL